MHTLFPISGFFLWSPNLKRRSRVIALCYVLLLTICWGTVRIDAAETTSSEPAPPAKEKKEKQDYPFFKDAKTILNLRNYYLNRDDLADKKIETWAQGGWLGFRTGRISEILSFGMTVYGSYKLYGPDDKDGALLLAPKQENITVLGELFAKLNYAQHELKLGRQEYNFPFVNRQDNRMIPNTFEGYSLERPSAEDTRFQYALGYVDKMKKRNSATFIPMSEAAGVPDIWRGAYVGGAQYKFADALSLQVFDAYTDDILNIFYAEAVSRLKTDGDLAFKLAAQFIQQNSVGDELLARSASSTYALGGQADISYRKAVLTLALTGNSTSEDLLSPYGTYAGYNSIIVNDYNRAGEYGLKAGLSYDFTNLGLEWLSFFGNYVWGFNAVDPETDQDIPNQDEFDFTVDFKPQGSWIKGLSVRLRTALIHEEGGRSLEDYRVIVNYPF